MWGSQEKIWGQKVNVKFFRVDPAYTLTESHGLFRISDAAALKSEKHFQHT